MDERVLVWAPARDGRLTCGFLTDGGFACVHCDSWEAFRAELEGSVGAVVIAGEFLSDAVVTNLQTIIKDQPPWSDLPVIIVAGTEPLLEEDSFGLLGNVAVLQRPVALDTLRSTVRAALRARRRQYEIRDLLRQRDEADRRKDEFLAMLAHELRNPLAPLRTALELFKLEPSADVVARAKATMERQIVNLTRLVDDLVDVSRITRRKIALKKISLDVRQSVHESVAANHPLASQRDLAIRVEAPQEPVIVEADPVRLDQMIGNLIANAIKFTPAGGIIDVSLEATAGQAVMRVRDNGIGISSAALDRVFELFEQGVPSLDRSHGGLGIGLTVVRLIAELHGGSAQIFSGGPGAGTEAVIHLPLQGGRVVLQPFVQPQAPPGRTGTRVLLIEDNRDVADMMAAYLQHVGHDVVQAHDGQAGIDAAMTHRPTVIVCDIGLPGLDGFEVARRLRHSSDFRSCVLIALSGYGEAADREKARAAGFTHHITKPADPIRLAALIAGEA
jgi:signal transduction histidine kinase